MIALLIAGASSAVLARQEADGATLWLYNPRIQFVAINELVMRVSCVRQASECTVPGCSCSLFA